MSEQFATSQFHPLSIVIPVWGSPDHVRAILKNLPDFVPEDAHVIFVDGGNKDGTLPIIKKGIKKRKNWHVLSLSQNTGFTGNCNCGICHALPESDVLLLNVDISGFYDGWLDEMRELATLDPVACVIPRLRDLNGGLNTALAYVDDKYRGFPLPCLDRDRGQYRLTEEIDGGTFAVALLTRQGLHRVGLLEESCSVYCSDSLWQSYAKTLGMKVIRAGKTTLNHAVGSSLGHAEFNYNDQMAKDTENFRACLPRIRKKVAQVHITGVVGFQTGYSRLTHGIARALEYNDVEVALTPLELNTEHMKVFNMPQVNDMLRRNPTQQTPTIAVTTPDKARNFTLGKRICQTMIEPNGIPQSWTHALNQLHEAWTFSEFNYAVFRNHGVKVPIRIMPPALDTNLFNPYVDPYRLPEKRDFNIVAVFEMGERKFVEWVHYALLAFRGHKDVALHLRINQGNGGIADKLTELAGGSWNTVPVRWIIEEIPEHEMGCFYRAADLAVCIGAEGIGMPAIEAMACGTPVLGFDWGAGGEYMTAERCLTCRPQCEVPALAKCPYYKGFQWGYPDWWHFVRLLRYAYENRDMLRARAARIAPYVMEEYNLRRVGQRYVEALFL